MVSIKPFFDGIAFVVEAYTLACHTLDLDSGQRIAELAAIFLQPLAGVGSASPIAALKRYIPS